VRIGIVGCGNISDIYLQTLPTFAGLEVVACADLLPERAVACAAQYGVQALTPAELLSDSSIELVVNLTIPQAHAEINLAALEAGKHVYTEKPFAVTREDGQRTLALARERGLRVGSAPDTVLGAGLQTARQLIDAGAIGQPVGFMTFMGSPGHESWHPDPAFFYQAGAGPLFDMGPYYLTALVQLFGPVRRVTGVASTPQAERTITSQPRAGEKIQVNTPTHIVGVLEFASGPVGSLVTSFDIRHHRQHRFEIYGSEGSVSLHDPNTFGGPVLLRRRDDSAWNEVPLTHPYPTNLRGLGVADMAAALLEGRPHRANGEVGYHILDLMYAFLDASREGQHIVVRSSCERPAAMPVGGL
jgi:predicted dehydrogenase